MPPVARSNIKKTATMVRQVQPTVPTRFASVPVISKDLVQQFREARKLREQDRLDRIRNCRLKNNSSSSINISVATSVSSTCSSGLFRPKPPATAKVFSSKSSKSTEVNKLGASTVVLNEGKKHCRVNTSPSTNISSNVRENRLGSSKLRRSGRRRSIHKSKQIGCKLKAPKADVKLTKTTQLRMLKADPLLQLSDFKTSSSNKILLPEKSLGWNPTKSLQLYGDEKSSTKMLVAEKTKLLPKTTTTPKKPLGTSTTQFEDSTKPQTPSRVLMKKTSFVSPLKQTPGPSPLRERLSSWLEKRNHSLDNFKHLKCFGAFGPVVKRPQTPFRKVALSSSLLKAIPESKESTPVKGIPEVPSDADVSPLNTTFTLEEEDKENICFPKEQEENAPPISLAEQQSIREFDQAYGVLSELHKLIQMGYPMEQCGLWLRAVRRRFPQCGDESIYWECLAALEEARGDLQTAVSCYERALLQGAEESSVQSSLDELLKKMSSLHIEPTSINKGKPQKVYENKLLDSSNIIKSSSIQFAVKEKYTPSKNSEAFNESDSLFTATPVRRSTRLGCTPQQGTPGLKCVKSLDFLQPDVRRSLVFHTNSALDPEN